VETAKRVGAANFSEGTNKKEQGSRSMGSRTSGGDGGATAIRLEENCEGTRPGFSGKHVISTKYCTFKPLNSHMLIP
jgi:hypothetical protein